MALKGVSIGRPGLRRSGRSVTAPRLHDGVQGGPGSEDHEEHAQQAFKNCRGSWASVKAKRSKAHLSPATRHTKRKFGLSTNVLSRAEISVAASDASSLPSGLGSHSTSFPRSERDSKGPPHVAYQRDQPAGDRCHTGTKEVHRGSEEGHDVRQEPGQREHEGYDETQHTEMHRNEMK